MNNNISVIHNFISKSEYRVLCLCTSSNLMNEIGDYEKKNFKIVDLKHDYSPLKPFVSVLKDSNISDYVVEKYSYSMHKQIFKDYFSCGACNERYDIILELENFYEKSRMRKSICDFFKNTKSGSYIFLNAQCMMKESLDILTDLENISFEGKLVFCFDSLKIDSVSDGNKKFIENLNGKSNFLNIPIFDSELFVLKENSFYEKDEVSEMFCQLTDFNQILSIMRNYRLFISHEEGKLFCLWILNNIQNLELEPSQKCALELEVAKILFDTDNLDESLIQLNKVIDTDMVSQNGMEALYYMAKVFARKKANQSALKYILVLIDKLKNHTENYLYPFAVAMEYSVSKSKEDVESERLYNIAKNALKDNGLINNYISICLNIPWTIINDRNRENKIHASLDEVMVLAKQIDNQHLISSICHRKAIVFSHYGKRENAMVYNQECNRIRTEIGEIQPILAIRNGISYESLNNSDYVQAYEIINDIVNYLYTLNDYSTIIDTLKNITYAVFFSRHFEMADEMLDLIMHFLNIFGLVNAANNSYLPATNDIIMYKAMIFINKGDFIHAQINYINITTNGNPVSSYDRPFLQYVKACCCADEDKLDQAEQAFKDGINEFVENCPSQVHKMCFMYFEFAKLLLSKGYKELSDKYLSQGFAFAKEKHLHYYTKDFSEITVDEYVKGVEPLQKLNISLSFLREKAEKDSLMNQLHKRIYDYQFLNRMKSFNGFTGSLKKYLEAAIHAIYEYIMARGIFIGSNDGTGWKKYYSLSRDSGMRFTSAYWKKCFDNTAPDTQLHFKSDKNVFYANISKYNFQFAVIVVPDDSQSISYDVINVLNIALSTIQSEIVMLRQKENLMFMSTTDQLSLLKNRRALQDFVISECERIRRIQVRKHINLVESVCFLDLDNFKYYNDTFGHQAGDIIIQEFSKLLKKTLRCVDFISRYGGDEFVLILPDTNLSEAFFVSQRIRESLEKNGFFIPVLNKFMPDRKEELALAKHISFSMGVCCNQDLELDYDLDMAVKNADKALYYSKEHGKGITTSWVDIKDIKTQYVSERAD